MKIAPPSFDIDVVDLAKYLTSVYNNVTLEVKDILKIGLDEYLKSQIEKYYYTNTFIHRRNKVPLYSVYYPISVQHENKKLYFNDPIRELGPNHFVCLIGGAGSGKSMLTKHIFLQCINNSLKIPHIIELRNLNTSKDDFETFVFNRLKQKEIKPSDDLLLRSIRNGNHLFIFDGYDELYSEKLAQINLELEDFTDKYRNNYFVLTSRPNAGAELLPRFKPFYFNSLLKSEIIEFLYKIIPEIERQQRIAEVIRKPESEDYFHYLNNPLLLSMFILTFENYPELPKTKSQFYRNVFETLYSTHDGILKNSFERQRTSGLKKEDFEIILNSLSYLLLVNGIYSISEFDFHEILKKIKSVSQINYNEVKLTYDLVTTVSILVKDGISIQYPHKSLQEYFAACFIKDLSEPTHKEEIFNTFSQLISTNTNDNYFNFWDLCNELDPQAFKKYFLVNELKKIREEIYSNDVNKVLIAISKIYGVTIKSNVGGRLLASKIDHHSRKKHGLPSTKGVYIKSFSSQKSSQFSILTYVNLISSLDWVGSIFRSATLLDIFADELVQAVLRKDISFEKGEEIKLSFFDFISKFNFVNGKLTSFLIDNNYKNRLLKIPEIISEKILELESEVIETEKKVKDLISLKNIGKS